jgi:hypothetical protein
VIKTIELKLFLKSVFISCKNVKSAWEVILTPSSNHFISKKIILKNPEG